MNYLPLNTYTSSNLCGIWYEHGYSCALDEVHTEIILIEHNNDNNFVRATKLVGDNCLSSGEITWEDILDLNSSNTITLYAGAWHGSEIMGFDGVPNPIENLNYITLLVRCYIY